MPYSELDIETIFQDYKIQDDNYYNLPVVKSKTNKCEECKKQFGKHVLYRWWTISKLILNHLPLCASGFISKMLTKGKSLI